MESLSANYRNPQAVSAENPAAIRFYLREGFSEVGRIPAGFLHDGREIDDVMMVRRLLD